MSRKLFDKISSDGKITSSEAKQALKKGMSLADIERLRISSFREAQRKYQNTPTERRGPTPPTYSPLKISSGASKLFNPPSRSEPKPQKERPTSTTPTTPVEITTPTKPKTPDQEAITSLTQSLQKQLENLNEKYAGTTGQLSTLGKALKQQQRATARAAKKTARESERKFSRMQRQYETKSAAAQERYDQQLALFNTNLLAREEKYNQDLLAQQEAFEQAMLLRDQEAEQYRLAQEERAAAFEEQQRLQRESQRVGEQTFMSNQMRAASADPRFKIGMQSPGGGTYGTSQFKRRKDLRPTIFQGIQASTIPTIGGINI